MDHALDQARQAKGKLKAVEKVPAEVDKRLKESLTNLTEAERAKKNAKATLTNYEKQTAECLEAQRKAKNKLALNMVELKQLQKQLEAKDAEKVKVEQTAYNAGMTKTAESLTAQLRDVA